MIELNAGISMELTGRENITLLATIMGFSGRDIRRLEPGIMDFSELEDWIDSLYGNIPVECWRVWHSVLLFMPGRIFCWWMRFFPPATSCFRRNATSKYKSCCPVASLCSLFRTVRIRLSAYAKKPSYYQEGVVSPLEKQSLL